MDYIKIIVDGNFIDNPYLYFKDKFLEADYLGIKPIDFLYECQNVIETFESDIEFQMESEKARRREELIIFKNSLVETEEEGNSTYTNKEKQRIIQESRMGIESIIKNDFSFQISKYYKLKLGDKMPFYIHMDLTFDEIGSLKKNLKRAFKQINKRKKNERKEESQKLVGTEIKEIIELPKDKNLPSYNKRIIESKLKFLLKDDLRKHKAILELNDYNLLVDWITFYFDNKFELPFIENPIGTVNTAKGNMIFTFVSLYDEIHPNKTRPDSLFELLKLSFYPYRNDKISNLKKSTKKPQYYDSLLKS